MVKRKTFLIFFAMILILSVIPNTTVVEARNANQQSSVTVATLAVEKAEQYRTWEYVNLAQAEIENLGNGRPIRESKEELQKRLDTVKFYLNNKPAEPIVEEPVIEDPVIEEPIVEEDSKEAIYHTVVAGDTLWLISLQYGVSIAEIKELNHLTSDMLLIGQVLLIVEGDEPQKEDGVVKDPSKDLIILGYYTKYWSTDLGSYHSLKANHDRLNAIATASIDVNADGTISGFIPHEGIDFANNNHVKTYATFQNHFDPNITRAIFTNSALQETVISNMLSFVKQHGYKGANLNFENMYAADRALFNTFVEDMTKAFHQAGYPVMISVPAKTCDCPTWAWSGTFDFEFLGKSDVDYIQLMSYDQHGSWGTPGPIAGHAWMQTVLNYATSHINSTKLLLGLPAYGTDWNMTKHSGHQARTLKQIDTIIATHNPEIKWNEREQTPYFNYVDANGDHRTIYFENFDSLSVKTNLVHKYNLAGVSMWRMGQENDLFWLAVENGLKNN